MGATGLDVEALVDEETAVVLTSTGLTVPEIGLGMLNRVYLLAHTSSRYK